LKNIIKFSLNLPAQTVTLERISGEQRRHQAAAIHFHRGLRQILKEILQPDAPFTILRYFLTGIHQNFVNEQIFSRRCFPLFRFIIRMKDFQPFLARQLPGQDTPRLFQRARLARRRNDFHAFFHIQFVKA